MKATRDTNVITTSKPFKALSSRPYDYFFRSHQLWSEKEVGFGLSLPQGLKVEDWPNAINTHTGPQSCRGDFGDASIQMIYSIEITTSPQSIIPKTASTYQEVQLHSAKYSMKRSYGFSFARTRNLPLSRIS
jgi:hypothetical protein